MRGTAPTCPGGQALLLERTQWVQYQPGWTLNQWPPASLCPLQLWSNSPHGTSRGCCPRQLARLVRATDRDCEQKDTTVQQCRQPCVSHAGREEAYESGAFGHPLLHPPQGNPGQGVTPAPSLPQAWPWHGQRKDCCFFLGSITCRAWCLLMASQGAHWPSTAEAGAPVLHPCLISVASTADRTSLATSSPLETGTQPCWCFCQLRGLALPSTGLATLPRAASARCQCLPWLCQAFPCSLRALSGIPGAGHWRPCREARGGAERYFTGYFTCWHQLFFPSAPNHVPEPLTLPSCLPSHSASLSEH